MTAMPPPFAVSLSVSLRGCVAAAGKHIAFALVLLTGSSAFADSDTNRFAAGGYFRVSTRPDFSGGDGKLGFYNLYGRLMNEGPYAALEMRLDMLQKQASRANQPWTSVHAKVEGGSVANADPNGGALENFALTQLYAKAGNVGVPGVTWQLGTLDSYFGDLGLYDMKPAQIFFDTVGLSARYERPRFDLLVGGGDAGYFIRRDEYDTIFTGGGTLRVRLLPGHFEIGGGGQVWHEPKVAGNRFAPQYTRAPGTTYEDYVRGEVAQIYLDANPGGEGDLNPIPTSNTAWKAVGYLGFGAGPIRWNNLFMNVQKRLPENFYVESATSGAGTFDYPIHEARLTDERYQLNVGNEMQLTVIPRRLDAAWAVVYGDYTDGDNDILPSDDDQTFYSTVLRLQYYLTNSVHVLGEGALAKEISRNGNRYREHEDSVFVTEDGVTNNGNGLQFGDADTRNTVQGKFGFVLNPTGVGVFNRPSLRVLYGVQYSSQNNAFGNSFATSLADDNYYGTQERHLHHVIGLEAEAWF